MAGDPGAIPGINWTQVTPAERARLQGLIEHYRKKPHPFTACVRDNEKRFGPDRVKRICAVLKDLIEGGTDWRKGGKRSMEDAGRPLDAEETRALIEMAEGIRESEGRSYAFVEGLHPRNPVGPGGGRFKKKDGAAKPTERRKTIRWGGHVHTKESLLARLKQTGVPVEAWAWKHKAAARSLGIPVPATMPTAALRRLQHVVRRASDVASRTKAKPKGKPVPMGAERVLSEDEAREFAFDESKVRREAKGTRVGGRFAKKFDLLARADAKRAAAGDNVIHARDDEATSAALNAGELRRAGPTVMVDVGQPRLPVEITPKGRESLRKMRVENRNAADRANLRLSPEAKVSRVVARNARERQRPTTPKASKADVTKGSRWKSPTGATVTVTDVRPEQGDLVYRKDGANVSQRTAISGFLRSYRPAGSDPLSGGGPSQGSSATRAFLTRDELSAAVDGGDVDRIERAIAATESVRRRLQRERRASTDPSERGRTSIAVEGLADEIARMKLALPAAKAARRLRS
jgi:hypothetical protein